jgi:hypothetical protein
MTERWLHELGKVRSLDPTTDLMDRVDESIEVDLTPLPTTTTVSRLTTIAIVFVILALGSWAAFGALRHSGDATQARDGGQSAMTWPDISPADAQRAQELADAGSDQWRLDPGSVALRYGQEVLGWPNPIVGTSQTDNPDMVVAQLSGPDASCSDCGSSTTPQQTLNLTLQRLVRPGDGGVWSVTSVGS